jgi:lipoprotein NlpI
MDEPIGDLVDAEQALARGRLDEAQKLVDRYIAGAPEDARGHYLSGVIHDQQGRWAESVAAYGEAIRLDPSRAGTYQRRGVASFMLGRAKNAVADFDKYLELQPGERAHHWQRGIALYYAGRFEDGAKQFELHRTVNPDDVENSAWHFLCVAKWRGVDAARKSLIDVKGDSRVPMMKVQEMLAGRATPADVIAECERGEADERERRVRRFYGHLYVGLNYEALGEGTKAREHIGLAAGKYLVDGYMGGVAKAHVKLADGKAPSPAGAK